LRKDTLLTIYKKKDYEKLKYCPAVKFRNIEAYLHFAPHSAEFRRHRLDASESDSEDKDTGMVRTTRSRDIMFQVDAFTPIEGHDISDPVVAQPVLPLLIESGVTALDWNW
jgi:hypothetical protein